MKIEISKREGIGIKMCKELEDYVKESEKKGFEQGKIEGKLEGMIEGKLEGMIEGKLEGKILVYINLIGKGVFSVEEAARYADMSVKALKKEAKRLGASL